MDDDISKGLGALVGELSPQEEKIAQARAREAVGRRLGVTIPDPNEKPPEEPDRIPYASISNTTTSLDLTKGPKPIDEYSKENIKREILQKERQNIKHKRPKHFGMSGNEILVREIVRDEAQEKLKAFVKSEDPIPRHDKPKLSNEERRKQHYQKLYGLDKPYKAKKTGLDKNWSLDRAGLEKKYKYPVRNFDGLDDSTYPSKPKVRTALAHGTATDQINEHHKDHRGKLLSKESSRKTLQYISDTNTKYSDQPKANWLFNPVTGELEDTNDPQWIEKSEKKMAQFEDNKVDHLGRAEPKIGTDAHKEKYPERYKSGYVSKSDRIVSQLKELKEFGKNKLNK